MKYFGADRTRGTLKYRYTRSRKVLSEQARAEPLSQRGGTGTRAAAGRGNWNWFRLTSITQKERTGAHTAHRQKSQDRSYEDKSSGAATPPVGHRQEVPAGCGPRNSWRLPTTIRRDRGRGSEREDSPLLLAPTPRRRAASRRPVPKSCRSPQSLRADDAASLHLAKFSMDLSAFPLCHSPHVTVLYDQWSCLFRGPPSRLIPFSKCLWGVVSGISQKYMVSTLESYLKSHTRFSNF